MRTFLDSVELSAGGTAAGSPLLSEAGLNAHYRGAWSASATYVTNDWVTYLGALYRAPSAIAPSATFQAAFALVVAKGDQGIQGLAGTPGTFAGSYKGTYTDASTYAAGDLVTSAGSTYLATKAAGLLVNTLAGLALPTSSFTATQSSSTAYLAVSGQGTWNATSNNVNTWSVDFGVGNTYPISNITFTPGQTGLGFIIEGSVTGASYTTIYTWPSGTQNGGARSITPTDTTTAFRYVRFTFPAGGLTPSLSGVNMNLTTYRRPADTSGAWTAVALAGTAGTAGSNGTNGTNGLGLTFRGTYASGTVYAVNDIVYSAGSSYINILAYTGTATLPAADATHWSLIVQRGIDGVNGTNGTNGTFGSTYQGTWTAKGYNSGDVVTYLGSTYLATTPPDQFDTPGTAGSAWKLVASKGDAGATGATGTSSQVQVIASAQTLYLRQLYDDFNRTDGTIGADWGGDTGTARVVSNQLSITVANTVANVYKYLGALDHAVLTTVNALPTDNSSGVLLRFLDANNFIYVGIAPGGAINVSYNLAGTYTTIINPSAAGWVAVGDQVRASVIGTTVTLENLSRPGASTTLTGTLPTSGAVAARGVNVGFRLYSSAANAPFRFDNFVGYAIESTSFTTAGISYSRFFLFGGR